MADDGGRVVVLGGGSTGEAFAAALRRVDPDVPITLVEREFLGGECTYWACMPSKTLLRPLEVVAAARRAPGAAEAVNGDAERERIFWWRERVTDELDGIEVDDRLQAAENVWAIGDVTRIALFTRVGKYQARVAAVNVAGGDARADYRAVPAVAFTDPQVASVGRTDGEGLVSARWEVGATSRSSTYERPKRPGFVAEGPVDVLRSAIQPFPTFSQALFFAARDLSLEEARAG